MIRQLLFATWLLTLSASAQQLLDGLTGYYTFESESGGVTPNAARELGAPGFANDGARLLGGDVVSGGTVPLTKTAASVRAGAGALACDGSGDYARLDVNPVNVAQDFTVAVWFKPQYGGAGAPAARSFVIESKPGFVISFGLRPGTTGATNFQFFTDAASGTDPSASFNVPNADVDQWHHVAIRYVAGTQTIEGYIDGFLRYTLSFTGGFSAATGINTGTYRSADNRWFKGFIDEEVFWQRALSPDEIQFLYLAGAVGKTLTAAVAEPDTMSLKDGLTAYYGFDEENNREVVNSAVALGAPGFFGDSAILVGDYNGEVVTVPPITNDAAMARSGKGALLCDGINNYASIAGNPLDINQSFSVSVWFKPDTGGFGYGTDATRGFIYESGGTDSYSISFGLRGGTSSTVTNYQLFTLQSSASKSQSYFGATDQLDQWHHYVESYDVTIGTIVGYLDGEEVHRITGLTPLHAYSGMLLGTYRSADTRWFKGLIDEVAFWQRPLTPEEVGQIYHAGLDGTSLADTATGGGGNGLAVTAFGKAASGSGYTITWRTVPGLKYTLEASGDLFDWSTELVSDYVAPGTSVTFDLVPDFPPPEGALYDPGLFESDRRFYRVKRK